MSKRIQSNLPTVKVKVPVALIIKSLEEQLEKKRVILDKKHEEWLASRITAKTYWLEVRKSLQKRIKQISSRGQGFGRDVVRAHD